MPLPSIFICWCEHSQCSFEHTAVVKAQISREWLEIICLSSIAEIVLHWFFMNQERLASLLAIAVHNKQQNDGVLSSPN